jgi:hypothetical protein
MTILSALVLSAGVAGAQAVEVPFRLGEDAIIVDAVVNNRKVSLMFDTGFSGAVVLNASIDIGPRTGTMTLRDFVGTFQAQTAKIKSLKLGQKTIDATDMEAVLTGDRDYSFSYNTHVDGIMGFEVLQGNVVEINFEHKKFIFHPNSVDITKRTPDNKRTFLTRLLPTGHNALELEAVAPTGKKLILALDTGNAFYATTHKDSLERVGLWETGKEPKFLSASMVASGAVASWEKRMKNMVIFGVPVAESYWDIIDLPSSSAESDGTVGFGFLKNFNIIFDYERRRVWFDNFTGVVANETPGDIGVAAFVDPADKRLKIFRVAPESPADKAGIKRGDHILSLNGVDNLNVGFRKLRKMLEGPVGTKVDLAISRNGNLMRFTLERAALVND